MKIVFSKSDFPTAPGGDRYEWLDAKTDFSIKKTGLHVIKIKAKAKNAKQNKSTDDDDLRIALDGFHFGKYEKRKDKISWKGFGTSSAWDGASLKGGTKTIYYFVELDEGGHNVQFFADGTPKIENFELFEIENLHFELNDIAPKENIVSDKKGIPWLSFVFLGSRLKSLLVHAEVKSAKEKGTTDGDNLKIVVNGKILKNTQMPSSKKYQNFYFSGDVKQMPVLTIGNEDLANPLAFENSVEFWYDNQPKILNLQIDHYDHEGFLEEYKNLNLEDSVFYFVNKALFFFRKSGKIYSEKFLKHSLEKNPSSLAFSAYSPITQRIKKDSAYDKILAKVKERIAAGTLEGELWPKDFDDHQIYFNSNDLATALHGIVKVEYKAYKLKNGEYKVNIILFDVYDFQKADLPYIFAENLAYLKQLIVNASDFGETVGLINNYEISIKLKEIIYD